MAFFDEQLLAEARDFLSSKVKTGAKQGECRVVIAYHGDGDGCCSAYFLRKYIQCPADFYWVATPDFDFAKLEQYLCQKRPNLTIFLDMPVFNRPEMVEKLSTGGDIFIYDHHKPGALNISPDTDNVFYINPVAQGLDMHYPTSIFGWDLLQERSEFDRAVLFMGLFSETWLEEFSLFEDLGPEVRDGLKEMSRRIHSSFLISEMSSSHYALNFLLKASEGEGLSNAAFEIIPEYRILENIYTLIQNEKKWLLSQLNSEIRRIPHPRFILKRIQSNMQISGLIASELRWKYPRLVTGIWQKWGNGFHCELRRGRYCSVDLASLVHDIKGEVKLITGGGHPTAAGFTAKGQNFFEAIERIKNYITGDRHPRRGRVAERRLQQEPE